MTVLVGETTATIDVNVVDSGLLEDNETVIVTLVNTDDIDVSVDADNASATIKIVDDDKATVTIIANDASASEPNDDGQFTVTMSAASDKDTLVKHTIVGTADAGADFRLLSGSVTIEAGLLSSTIEVRTIDDTVLEDHETVTVTLTGIASANPQVTIDSTANSAFVLIDDDDIATVHVSAIDVQVVDDTFSEDNETLTLMLTGIAAGDSEVTVDTSANVASVNISDNDKATVSISVSDADATEPGDAGQFTVTMSAESDKDTEVTYTVTGTADGGVDYTTLSGTVAIAAGEKSATIDISVVDDAVLEESETVIVALVGTDDGDASIDDTNNTASITIADNDTATVSIAASDADAAEPNDDGQFTVTLSQISDKDTDVSYVIAGTADSGSDFVALTGTVTILKGDTSAAINIQTLDSDLLEETETVIVTLVGTSDSDVTVAASGTTKQACRLL